MQDDGFDQAARKERLRIAYHNVFSGEEGEMVLHDLVHRHSVFSPRFPGGLSGPVDGMTMAIQNAWYEGRRSVPLEIMGMLSMQANEAVHLQEQIRDAMGGTHRMAQAIGDEHDD